MGRPAAWAAMHHSVTEVRPCSRGLREVSMRELLTARAREVERGLAGLTFDNGYAHSVGNRYACAIAPYPGIAGDPALPHIDVGRSGAAVHLEPKRRPARVWGRALEKTA
ncbi:hypothetical protein AB5J72_18015 [Streptomyces sp. CG1]|uniref:hypothetical protein n=1 Tax=Streptomyces sp. CG1 TaxID=1287523 RepID=UPI0034E266C8